MCSEHFPFIVRYPSGDRLTLVGVRDIPSLREVDVQSFAEENGWPHWVQMTPIEEFLRNQRTERPFWVRKPLPKGTTRWRNRKTRAKHNRIGWCYFLSYSLINSIIQEREKKEEEERQKKLNQPEGEEDEEQETDPKEEEKIPETDFKEQVIYGLLRASAALDPMAQAGYVICDPDFNRTKIESPQFRLLRQMNTTKEPVIASPEIFDYLRTNQHK